MKQQQVYIRPADYRLLKQYSKRMDRPMAWVLTKAIREYIDKAGTYMCIPREFDPTKQYEPGDLVSVPVNKKKSRKE